MPRAAFEFDYPVKGDADPAADIAGKLGKTGFAPVSDHKRGFDHGVYVPMTLEHMAKGLASALRFIHFLGFR